MLQSTPVRWPVGLFAIAIFLLMSAAALAQPVDDNAAVFSQSQSDAISMFLDSVDNDVGIHIITLLSLDNASIEAYTESRIEGLAESEGTLFIIFAKEERQYHVDSSEKLGLDDAQLYNIAASMVPSFKKSEYGLGIIEGLNTIALELGLDARINTTALSQANNHIFLPFFDESKFHASLFWIVVLFLVLIYVLTIKIPHRPKNNYFLAGIMATRIFNSRGKKK